MNRFKRNTNVNTRVPRYRINTRQVILSVAQMDEIVSLLCGLRSLGRGLGVEFFYH